MTNALFCGSYVAGKLLTVCEKLLDAKTPGEKKQYTKDLAEAAGECRVAIKESEHFMEVYKDEIRDLKGDNLGVDEGALVSVAEDGFWIQSWGWIDTED